VCCRQQPTVDIRQRSRQPSSGRQGSTSSSRSFVWSKSAGNRQEARWHPSNSSGLCMEATCRQGGLYSCEGCQCILVSSETTGIWSTWGAEAAVRAARLHLDNLQQGQLFLKIDFRNAFNTLRRDAILEAIAKHFPELLLYATSTMDSPSDLQLESSSCC